MIRVHKKILTNMLLVAGAIITVMIVLVSILLLEALKVQEPSTSPAKKELINVEKVVVEPGQAIPQSIFPTFDEAKENLKNQLERQQILDKALTERKEVMAEVRRDVEASFNEKPELTNKQPASTSGQSASTATQNEAQAANGPEASAGEAVTTFLEKQNELNSQKGTTARSGNKDLYIRH